MKAIETDIVWIKEGVTEIKTHLKKLNGSVAKIKEVQLVHQGNLDKHCLRLKAVELKNKEAKLDNKEKKNEIIKFFRDFGSGFLAAFFLYILTLL